MKNIDPKLLAIFQKINLDNQVFNASSAVAKQFHQVGIDNLYAAINYIYHLKYQPPSDPFNWNLVLPEQCGTCSTRHALLVSLAKELNLPFSLGHAIYNLTPERFPKLKEPLEKTGLPFIPESHNFIVFNDYFLDITFPGDAKILPRSDVDLMEIIECNDLLRVKKILYPQFLKQWLKKQNNDMTLEQYAAFHNDIVKRLG